MVLGFRGVGGLIYIVRGFGFVAVGVEFGWAVCFGWRVVVLSLYLFFGGLVFIRDYSFFVAEIS